MATPDRRGWLSLADGSGWRIEATREAAPWFDTFASAVGLLRDDPGLTDPAHLHLSTRHADAAGSFSTGDPVQQFSIGPLRLQRRPKSDTLRLIVPTPGEIADEDWKYSLWYAVYTFYPHLLRLGHLPLHAGLAERNGFGILFSAPGGTGKSTTLRRLPEPWRPICDDESWLVAGPDGALHAHPLPTWSDWILNGRPPTARHTESLPAAAIIFLRQAGHDRLSPLSPAEAAPYLYQATEQMLRRSWSVLQPPDLARVRARAFAIAAERARNLPAFLLDLTLDGAFWTLLEEAGIGAE